MSVKPIINFAKVNPEATIPTKERENAGYDIYACFEDDFIIINPDTTTLVPTGIASCISEDYYLQVEERSSSGSKGIKKSAGIIDSGYRGEIFIALTNCNNKAVIIAKNPNKPDYEGFIVYPYSKAIAQLILHESIDAEVEEITYEELKQIPSKRGNGCLGSTGV